MPGKPKHILIAEDDMAMRDIMNHKLTASGFEVTTAEDGKQALELIPQVKPDLILLDLMMPEVDGYGVLEALRKNPDQALSKTPVIVLSNLWSSNDILKVKGFYVDDFLIKAYFTPEEILAKIKATLAKYNK